MLRVGLTGGIGSGKSEVTSRLRELGAVVIDSDVLAREVVRAGTPGFEQVVAQFGEDVLGSDGELDRARLGRVVFADPDLRRALERIVHPLVRARVSEVTSAAADDAVVVNDVPLLVESGLQDSYDVVVVVDTPPEIQRDRLVRIRGMSAEDADARVAAQVSRAERLAAADAVVRNDGDLDALDARVTALWEDLAARAGA